MSRNGFTIWQLLGVLAVILVVAAILFPVFIPQHEPSRKVTCTSNLKQLGLAVIQYTQDNDECLPNIAAAPGSRNTWRVAIFPYCKYQGIYQCPSRSDKLDGLDGYPRSYAANYTGNYSGGKSDQGNGAFAGPGSRPISVADINAPDELIALCEVSQHTTPDFNIDSLAVFDPHNRTLWAGHEDRGNYLLADAHVKRLHPLDTQALWHRQQNIPLTPAAVAILSDAQNRAGW